MVLLHVDDFMISGDEDFIEKTTDMFKKELTVSKVEDKSFRYCGVDLIMDESKLLFHGTV